MTEDKAYNRMTANELKEAIKSLAVSQRELGRWLEKDERTARRYVLGESKVSPELAILFNLLQERPELVAHIQSRISAAIPQKRGARRKTE